MQDSSTLALSTGPEYFEYYSQYTICLTTSVHVISKVFVIKKIFYGLLVLPEQMFEPDFSHSGKRFNFPDKVNSLQSKDNYLNI